MTARRDDPAATHDRRRQHAPTRRAATVGSSPRWAVAPLRPGGAGPPAPIARRPPAARPGRARQASRRSPAAPPAGQRRSGHPTRASGPAARSGTRTSRLTDRFSAGQPRRRLITHARRDAAVLLAPCSSRSVCCRRSQGDALRSAAAQQWTRDRPAAGPARLDLRPQRRGAGAVGAGQHDRRQPQAGDRPGGHGDDVRPGPRPQRASGATSWRRRWPRRTAVSSTSPARSTTSSPSRSRRLELAGVVDLPRGPPDAAGRRHRPQRDRPHRHRRHRHRRPRGAVRQRAHRHARRVQPRGGPGRSLDRRQRAGRRRAPSPATTSC